MCYLREHFCHLYLYLCLSCHLRLATRPHARPTSAECPFQRRLHRGLLRLGADGALLRCRRFFRVLFSSGIQLNLSQLMVRRIWCTHSQGTLPHLPRAHGAM